jgi:hypothetical protein
MAAMQDSLLSIESSKTGWKTYESSILGMQTVCIVGRLAMDCVRLMTLDRLGIE